MVGGRRRDSDTGIGKPSQQRGPLSTRQGPVSGIVFSFRAERGLQGNLALPLCFPEQDFHLGVQHESGGRVSGEATTLAH